MTEFFRPGRLLHVSKRDAIPRHLTCYNANIFTREAGKIWWGDLDVTADAAALQALAASRGEELYILREKDGRFEHEHGPTLDQALDQAVARVTADGVTILPDPRLR